MKFNLNFKKSNIPSVEFFRKKLFNTQKSWIIILLVFVFLVLTLVFFGLNIFYNQYFENYKKSRPTNDFEGVINVEKLDSLIKKRTNEINKNSLIPKDPSL